MFEIKIQESDNYIKTVSVSFERGATHLVLPYVNNIMLDYDNSMKIVNDIKLRLIDEILKAKYIFY